VAGGAGRTVVAGGAGTGRTAGGLPSVGVTDCACADATAARTTAPVTIASDVFRIGTSSLDVCNAWTTSSVPLWRVAPTAALNRSRGILNRLCGAASFEESIGDGVAIAAPRWERAQRVNRLRAPVLATQGTGTGRGIIARISLQAMSHISLAMMAGSQNNIGMVNLLCGVTLQRRPAFQCSQSFQDL
jgi:hypothetical protein